MSFVFFFQAEDGIRDTDRSRGLGDVYKRQDYTGIILKKVYYKRRKCDVFKKGSGIRDYDEIAEAAAIGDGIGDGNICCERQHDRHESGSHP